MTVITEKSIIKQILEKYRDLPLLWDSSHDLYTNKVARKEANEKLLEIYKLCEPGAMLVDIRKKIENMRTTYKREHQKVMKPRFSGEEEYVPSLWYYDLFSFLNDDENVSISSKVSKHNVSAYDDYEEDDGVEREEDIEEGYILKTEEMYTAPPPKKKKRKSNILYLSGDNQESYTIDDQPNRNGLDTSSAELFGKTIGIQLNELKPLQRFIAEKLMSEVIFYGRLDKLQPSTALSINLNEF